MKKSILHKVYTRGEDGFIDLFLSEELEKHNKKVLRPLSPHYTNQKRFLYKSIENLCIFIQSVPSGYDEYHRNNYFVHFIIFNKNFQKFNPASYIDSSTFCIDLDSFNKRKSLIEEGDQFEKNKLSNQNDFKKKDIIYFLDFIILHLSELQKIIVHVDKNLYDNIYQIFNLLPPKIAMNTSFSIDSGTLVDNNICDINFTTINVEKKLEKYQVKTIKKVNIDNLGEYTQFILKHNEPNQVEIKKLFKFIEKNNFKIYELNKAVKSYLISIGEYIVTTDKDILDCILGISSKKILLNFLETIQININKEILLKIDDLVSRKYFEDKTIDNDKIRYFNFLVKYSYDNYEYFIKKYSSLYLRLAYNFPEKEFLQKIEKWDIEINTILEFAVKYSCFNQMFYIQKNELIYLNSSFKNKAKNLLTDYIEIQEKEIFNDFYEFTRTLNLEKRNEFLRNLIKVSSKSIQLFLFINDRFRDILDEVNQKSIYEFIEENLSSKILKDEEFNKFLVKNNFNKSYGLKKLKLLQIKSLLRVLDVDNIEEKSLNKIIDYLNSKYKK